jgi:hypothetical protein
VAFCISGSSCWRVDLYFQCSEWVGMKWQDSVDDPEIELA